MLTAAPWGSGPSPIAVVDGGILLTTQCTYRPEGASGSSTTTASDSVPGGTFCQRSGGGTLRPLQEYSAGIGVLSPNAELVTVNLADPAGGGVVVLVAAAEVVGRGDCGFTLLPPHAGSAKSSR